jgi:hypothetical protein
MTDGRRNKLRFSPIFNNKTASANDHQITRRHVALWCWLSVD